MNNGSKSDPSKGRILIIDDDEMMCKAMAAFIERMGHRVSTAFTLQDGLKKAESKAFDLVFLDVMLPDGSGLDILSDIKETSSGPEVIIITASGDPDGAELAIKSGAWDYIEKKPSIKALIPHLTRALEYRQDQKTKTPDPIPLKRERIVGNSPKMKACLDLLGKAVVNDANVLIVGETGTGKELFARATHYNRPRGTQNIYNQAIEGKDSRSDKNFVVVDCTALPETLVESVLFGHEKGAFTGADKAGEGLIIQANGGTLFLDEVGELPLIIQKKFLRVLQEHQFRPVGASKEVKSDFRLVAATNKDLDQMAKKGEFRKDLLFRLRSLTIELPSLRERREDINDLTRFHITRLCGQYAIERKGFSSDFFDTLKSYNWPGNVRELINALDGALAAAGDAPTLFSMHLPIHMRISMARHSVTDQACLEGKSLSNTIDGMVSDNGFPKLRDFRKSSEKQYLRNLLSISKRNMKDACEISGLSRSRLYELISKHQLS